MGQDFEGRDVVVTGATGGLGSAVVGVLAARGAVCHLPSRRAAVGLHGIPETAVRITTGVDLTDEGAVVRFYGGVSNLWASIHLTGGFAMEPIADTSLERLAGLWSINGLSCFLCCREAVRRMRAAGKGGRIVNVAARPALEPRTGAGMVAYTMTKSAVAGLTVALGEEVAGEGIWVNAVAPSILDTPANRSAIPGADPARWAKVDEVAETIAFLASPRNGSTRSALVPVYGRT